MNAPETNWPSWVAKADSDRLCIRNNLASDEIPWDVVCYHAQQAAEKMLKALLVSRGVQPRKTHDLVGLLQETLPFDETLAELADDCDLLNAYATDVRYPDLFEPTRQEGEEAVAATQRVGAAIRQRLEQA